MIRGQVLVSRFRYIRKHHSRATIEQVLETLPEEDRAQLAELRRDKWYPDRTVLRLDRAIARLLSPDDTTIFERLGEATARDWSEWVGADASLISVHSLLSRAAERHREIQSFGVAAYRRLGFTEGELVFSECPEVDEVWCRSAMGFLRESVRTVSGGPVGVEETRCQSRGDAACVFRFHWGSKPGESDRHSPGG